MKTVPLHGAKAAGRVALVDDEDYDLVMQYRWFVKERQRPRRADGPYAITKTTPRRGGGQVTIYMHKLLTGWPSTDHINHDGLDNQRHNLRPATAVQNGANRRPVLGHSSRYKGVGWYSRHGNWRAHIRHGGRLHHLGYFAREEDAAKAYDVAAQAVFGEYAQLNFPDQAA